MCHRFGGWVNFDADPDLLKGRDMIMFEKVKQFSYGNQPNDRYTLDKLTNITIFGIPVCLTLKYFNYRSSFPQRTLSLFFLVVLF